MPTKKAGEKYWTGDGFVRVKDGSKFEFTMVRVPQSGNYDMLIRYNVEVIVSCALSNFQRPHYVLSRCNKVHKSKHRDMTLIIVYGGARFPRSTLGITNRIITNCAWGL